MYVTTRSDEETKEFAESDTNVSCRRKSYLLFETESKGKAAQVLGKCRRNQQFDEKRFLSLN